MSEGKMTDAEIQELRVEIAKEFADKLRYACPVEQLPQNERTEYYTRLGMALEVAHIALWKIFRQGRFDICKKKPQA